MFHILICFLSCPNQTMQNSVVVLRSGGKREIRQKPFFVSLLLHLSRVQSCSSQVRPLCEVSAKGSEGWKNTEAKAVFENDIATKMQRSTTLGSHKSDNTLSGQKFSDKRAHNCCITSGCYIRMCVFETC